MLSLKRHKFPVTFQADRIKSYAQKNKIKTSNVREKNVGT